MRILYIDIDSLRPDHLGCHGYHRNTSPHIDALAEGGIRFDNVYVSDAPCMPSRTALWISRCGFHTGVVNHGRTVARSFAEGPTPGFRNLFGTMYAPDESASLQGSHNGHRKPFLRATLGPDLSNRSRNPQARNFVKKPTMKSGG